MPRYRVSYSVDWVSDIIEARNADEAEDIGIDFWSHFPEGHWETVEITETLEQMSADDLAELRCPECDTRNIDTMACPNAFAEDIARCWNCCICCDQ